MSASLSSCAGSTQQLCVAAHIWPGYEPLFLAQREGWLASKYVKLLETGSATESMQAMMDGKVHAAALTLDEVLKLRAQGLPVLVVLVFDVSVGADMLLARADLQQLTDLKGRRVGYEASAVGAVMLGAILHAVGFSKADIQPVALQIDEHLQAWQQQRVDAVITYEPVASQLMNQGAIKLFDSRQIPNTILDVLAIRADALEYADAIQHLIAAHFQALKRLQRHPQDAAYRMANHLQLSAAHVLPAFRGLLLPDVRNNYRLLSGNEPNLLTSARNLSSIMLSEGLLKQDDSLLALTSAEFLPRDFN